MLALPIQRFAPLSTQESPSRRTLVSSATESEPWSGSVRAKAPILSSAAIAGSQRCFCSSLPSRLIVPMVSPDCTLMKVVMLPSPRASSRVTMPELERRQPGAAVPLDRVAGQAEPGELRHQRPRELGAVPVVVDHRQEIGVDEGAHPVAHGAGLIGEQLVEQVVVGTGHSRFSLFVARVSGAVGVVAGSPCRSCGRGRRARPAR